MASEKPSTNPVEQIVKTRLNALGAKPHEMLGQHFLINQEAIDILANSVTPGNHVIEVGAGIGQVTEALAKNASHVTAIEIDRRFAPVLSDISNKHPNITIIYGDVLAIDLSTLIQGQAGEKEDIQIVASLPFHITEPFLTRMINLPVDSITLLLGQKVVDEMNARTEDSIGFGRLSVLAQTFYDIDVVARVEKDDFFPQPRTNGQIVQFTPKEEGEFRADLRTYIFKRLFDTQKKYPGIRNIVKDAIEEYSSSGKNLRKTDRNRYSRRAVKMNLRQAAADYNYRAYQSDSGHDRKTHRRNLSELGIPNDILILPFDKLDNTQLRKLYKALGNLI